LVDRGNGGVRFPPAVIVLEFQQPVPLVIVIFGGSDHLSRLVNPPAFRVLVPRLDNFRAKRIQIDRKKRKDTVTIDKMYSFDEDDCVALDCSALRGACAHVQAFSWSVLQQQATFSGREAVHARKEVFLPRPHDIDDA